MHRQHGPTHLLPNNTSNTNFTNAPQKLNKIEVQYEFHGTGTELCVCMEYTLVSALFVQMYS
eukprot:m.261399 g.261399  ORF g.261399 m.261399 type:complete len:62 (+) comp42094_c0_seq1:405-590(+)